MPLSRRRFMRETALAAGGLALAGTARAEKDIPMNTARPLFISTWPFGKAANEQSLRIAEQGGSVLDAVERGIHVAEADASNPSVGLGGIPNARGVVQLDACIMDGEGQRAGSVAAIEGILHPISVARRVMDETKHVMLAGEGARQFALEQGFASVELLTEERRKAWEEWREKQGAADNHDTIALLGLDGEGRLAGGCSTSGWGYKLPGRVGDSPIIGSGLYVDGSVGAAGATGLGENVMRYCATSSLSNTCAKGCTRRKPASRPSAASSHSTRVRSRNCTSISSRSTSKVALARLAPTRASNTPSPIPATARCSRALGWVRARSDPRGAIGAEA